MRPTTSSTGSPAAAEVADERATPADDHDRASAAAGDPGSYTATAPPEPTERPYLRELAADPERVERYCGWGLLVAAHDALPPPAAERP